MQGMSRTTGKPLSGTEHIAQSIIDILTTPLNTRVMLPEYGCNLFDLIDNPSDPALGMRIIMATAGALAKWEPRIEIESVNVVAIGIGKITISIVAIDVETRKRLEFNNLELLL
ncbi:GPW/gp25 family protein [Escherichia fergusonii]|uniref:GPW/gp25 family protein n=1 Tax=Escherichia fergusonii TaxID=564 RepID=UPI0020CFA745|nr:GPW/gp25 family protein [Escherichia fergusonii]MCP9660857.1 GPW/gp25 family protein [Escherichia fergusonii]